MDKSVKALANEVLGYAATLILATLAAFAANHGWHLAIPSIPAGVTATAVIGTARLFLKGLVKAWHSGKLEAQLVADVKRYGPEALADVIKAAEGR